MLRTLVSLTVRQLNPPPLGTANFFSSGRRASSSAEIARNRSATPFTLVIATEPPPDFGNQGTFVSFFCTSPFEQSPYILSKKAALRKRPGSSCGPGCFFIGPLG